MKGMSGDYRPSILIDTCALANKEFLVWVRGYSGPKSISAVTYMEFSAFQIDIGKDRASIDKLLRSLKIDVEDFARDSAWCAAQIISNRDMNSRRCPECDQINWNDTMIASQGVNYSKTIVTENTRDFPTMDTIQVLSTKEAMTRLDF